MNKRQKEVLTAELKAEQKTLRNLKAVYRQAAKDCAERAAVLLGEGETAQSKMYQARYQKSLEKQLDTILDRMNSKNYSTLSEYLNDCYTNGFVGAMYDISGQGVPLILPIDQGQVVRAVQLDSKISEGLYSRMGKDTKALKKQIKAQISRGISNGSAYSEIARNINGKMDIGYNNAVRIVRTEGHRIQSSSALDAMHAAKEKGADVVKQWDSTLDGKTRESHRRLDGQLRELDEPFETDGKRASAPGHFGSPKEDCNCRCALLQRARWALDEEELKTLQERAEYFGLDKTSDFEDFREKYLKAVDISGESGIIKTEEKFYPLLDDSFNHLASMEQLKAAWEPFVSQNVTDAEWQGINGGYVRTPNSFRINEKLRNNPGAKIEELFKDPFDLRTVCDLDSAINKNTLNQNALLTRNVGLDYLMSTLELSTGDIQNIYNQIGNTNGYATILKLLNDRFVNREVIEDAFLSASGNSSLNVFSSKPVRLEIKALKGTKALVTKNFMESEVILGRGTKYMIESIERFAIDKNNFGLKFIVKVV